MKPMGSLSDQGKHKAGRHSAALRVTQETQTSAVSLAAQDKAAAMLPPSKLPPYGILRPPASLEAKDPKRDSARIGRLPGQHSTSRKLSRDNSANDGCLSRNLSDLIMPRPQVRISSEGSDLHSKPKESYHGRSLSQQMRPASVSNRNALSASSLIQRQTSINHSRPAISAMQQHFSPKKCTLPDHSTLASQPASRDEIPSASTFHLQIELAQLHLLHRSAFSVQLEWEKSAKGSFERRLSALYERYTELKEVAHQQQSLVNQLSLVEWSRGRSGTQVAEKVQLLSHNVSDICNLLDSEGKHTHILDIFESWFAEALRVRDQRESYDQKIGKDLELIEGIGDGWKAETMVLERELTYITRDLEGFGAVQSASSLCRILSMYRKLMVGLLEELDLIQWIENEIMTEETSWIESTIQHLASSVSENVCSMGPDQRAV